MGEFTSKLSGTKAIAIAAGLACTLILVTVTAFMFPAKHEATASMLLLPGRGDLPASANPFLYLGDLSQARDVLVKSANSQETKEELLGSADDLDFEVQVELASNAPIILVRASGRDSASALALRDSVVADLAQDLDRLQDEALTPATARITSMVLASDEQAQRNMKSQGRSLLAAGLFGLGLTFAGVMGVQAISRRRRNHAGPVDPSPEAEGPLGTSGESTDLPRRDDSRIPR